MIGRIAGLMAALAVAGAAQAETTGQAEALAAAVRPGAAAPAVRLSMPAKDAEAYAMRRAGIARTAVERALAGDDVTGSLGFLCGIQPGAERSGVAAARGTDPSGRFLGAKLSLAFR